MEINDILDIQVDALAKTVCDYSTNNYIRNYATKLKELHYPEDRRKLNVLIDYLIEWYEGELETIKTNEYIHSKEDHLTSYKLLCDMKEIIKE